MYRRTVDGITKLSRNVDGVRMFQTQGFWHDGQPLPVVLDSVWCRAIATAFCLQLVSLFDDALETHIAASFPDAKVAHFSNRVEFLLSRNVLTNRSELLALRKGRNELAHDAGAEANWSDWDTAFRVTESALLEMRAIAGGGFQ